LQEELRNSQPTILITGASGDVGVELVKQSINNNWKVVALTQTISKLKNRLTTKEFDEIISFEKDLSKVNSPEKFNFLKKFRFNYVVLNAGILIKHHFENFSHQDIIRQFNVNFFSNVYLLQALLPEYIYKENNHILAIGSMSGVEHSVKFEQMSMYGASKSALQNLMQTLSSEYVKEQIVFNSIAFGAIKTQMLKHAFGEIHDAILPEEAAGFILNFIINGKKVANGKIISVSKSIV